MEQDVWCRSSCCTDGVDVKVVVADGEADTEGVVDADDPTDILDVGVTETVVVGVSVIIVVGVRVVVVLDDPTQIKLSQVAPPVQIPQEPPQVSSPHSVMVEQLKG